jgi:hypothetical protein
MAADTEIDWEAPTLEGVPFTTAIQGERFEARE